MKTKYEESRLWELLFRWHFSGSVKPYYASIRSLLRDSTVYLDADDNELNWGLIGPSGDSQLQSGVEISQFDTPYVEDDGDAYIGDLLGATNPVLALYWMNHSWCPLDDAQKSKYANLLNWDDQRIQYEVCETLSIWMHDPSHAPKLYASVRGEEIPYPDLNAMVAYWKKRFGIN